MIKSYFFGGTAFILFASAIIYNISFPVEEVFSPYKQDAVCVESVGLSIQNGLECVGDNDGELLATVTRSPDCQASFGYQFIWRQDGIEVRNIFAPSFVLTDVLTSANSSNGEVPPGVYEIEAFDYDPLGTGAQVLSDITLEVSDTEDPVAQCQNITVQLNASGVATITPGDIDNGSTDNCGIASSSLSQTSFDCSNIGVNSVNLTVTDDSGNSDSCSASITVEDNVTPTASCQDITVQLDASGNASISVSDVDAGSSDNCNIASSSLSATSFDCSDIGTNSVMLTVEDNSGNSDSCTATVTVEDSMAPSITCPADVTVEIVLPDLFTVPDYFGTGDATTSDNCTTGANMITSQTPAPGTELGEGVYTVMLTSEDESGNSNNCSFELTVDDVLSVNDASLKDVIFIKNPVTDMLVIDILANTKLVGASLFNVQGQEVLQLEVSETSDRYEFDTSDLSSGLYLLKISSEKGNAVFQLVKR